MQTYDSILVTVVIPCYNCGDLVGRAIESVISQSYPNLELILVDNNSSDNTPFTLDHYRQKYPQLIQIFSEKKKGACAARNLGVSRAKGEWIQFLDADDELLPQKIEEQLELVKKHDPDVVVGDYLKIRTLNGKVVREIIVAEDDPWLGVINSRLGLTSANLWKKETLLKVNGWNEELGSSQEYDLLFRLLKLKAKVAASHQTHTVIHAQVNSVSRTTNKGKLYQLIINRYHLRCQIYVFLTEHKLLNKNYKQQLYQYLYYHLLLISEFDFPYFKQQIKNYSNNEITIRNKMSAVLLYVRNSSKRKFVYSNLILKIMEWQFFFFKSFYLLRS